MRVVYLAAGAAGMYCGSCLRDNRLVAALLARGRDVLLLPLYTPLRTDEPDVSRPEVFYGGLNVYLQQKSPLFRRTPRFLDRWLDWPALLRGVGRLATRRRADELGELTISVLKGRAGAQRKELERLIAALRGLRPDLVNLPNLMFIGAGRAVREALGVPVLCTLSGEDLFLDGLPQPQRGQALALIRAAADGIDGYLAVTSYYARRCIERFGLPAERVHVVPLGVSILHDPPARDADPGPFTIGFLGRIAPEKGLAELAEAFAVLRRAGRACRLRAAGCLPPGERDYLQRVRSRLSEHGVQGGFEYLGEVDRGKKLEFLHTLDAFSMPSVYPEAKGLPVLEALERGVPVVQPQHGSFPELIEATGGGVLYDPREPQGLAAAIAGLMDDLPRRRRLGARGRAAVRERFSEAVMAEQTWAVYEQYVYARRAN